jgi:hypothetical protein
VRHGRYVVFQLAELAVLRSPFADILRGIDKTGGHGAAAFGMSTRSDERQSQQGGVRP